MITQTKKRKRGIMLTPKGWFRLQEAKLKSESEENFGNKYTLEELSERTGLDPGTIAKVMSQEEKVDKRTIECLFDAFKLELDKSCYSNAVVNKRQDWGEAVSASAFYGKLEELTKLTQWIIGDRCRLVALLGMGGIGKTALSIKLAEQIQGKFTCTIWRTLQNAPPVEVIVDNILQFLSEGQELETIITNNLSGKIARLISYLRQERCLIVLDNIDSVLQSGSRAGQYLEQYEGYSELLKQIAEVEHQSCLVLTSREKPKELTWLEGEALPVRSFQLEGLKEAECQKIFETKGLHISKTEIRTLVESYSGNALALKIVSSVIQNLFNGCVVEFLRQGTIVFGEIRALLEQQFERLSLKEKEIMYWLAIARKPISLSELRSDLVSPIMQTNLLEVLYSLSQRSLLEKNGAFFSLQPVVMEYVIQRFIEQICHEIISLDITLFRHHVLIKAQANEYIRDAQAFLILKPVIEELLSVFRCKSSLEQHLNKIIVNLQETSPLELGYTAGNVLNILCQLQTDLNSYDFSYLNIWQADLRNTTLHNVNFAHANLAKSVFAESFGGVFSVAFSPDGRFVVTGDSNGEICLWQVAAQTKLLTYKGHTNWVVSLAFSSDGKNLVSSSTDFTVKLWDVSTGQCLKTLQEHVNGVWSVVFSPDNCMLASGSDDSTVRLWNVSTGQVLKTLSKHTSWVRAVAFSPDGKILASGSDDSTVRLWDVSTGQEIRTLSGHSAGVRSIALNHQGTILASGSDDRTVRLWDVSTGQVLRTLYGHRNGVWSVAFSPDDQLLASAAWDSTIRLWDISTGNCLRILQGHTNRIFSIAFSPRGNTLLSGSDDQTVRLWSVSTGQTLRTLRGRTNRIFSVAFSPLGKVIASGSQDQVIRLWDISTEQCLKTLQGHTNCVYSVTFSPNGQLLASGSEDRTVRLWDLSTGRSLRTFSGHSEGIWAVAFSPDGQLLASGSEDRTVRLWDLSTGRSLRTFSGHSEGIWAVAFSPDGQLLASGSKDQTVKIWSMITGECLRTFRGHTSWVWSVVFSPEGDKLASGSVDQTVKLWSTITGECLKTFQGHTSWVKTVTFSPDGQLLASSSHDQTVRLWDLSTGQTLNTFQGHTAWVWSASFSPDCLLLASSSEDETIKIWDVRTRKCLKSLKAEKPYERTQVAGVTGLSEATLATLRTLGAVG